jgi:hypothetical protein
MVCTSVLGLNTFIFITTNSNCDNIYCECNGRMFNFLNYAQQDSLFPHFIIILITLLDFKNSIAVGRIAPKSYTVRYEGMHSREIDYSYFNMCFTVHFYDSTVLLQQMHSLIFI